MEIITPLLVVLGIFMVVMIWTHWKSNRLTKAEKRKYEGDRNSYNSKEATLAIGEANLRNLEDAYNLRLEENKKDFDLENKKLEKKKNEMNTLLERASILLKQDTSKIKFLTARVYDYEDMSFLEEMNKIFVSEEFRFLIFALKEECMDQVNVSGKEVATEWFHRLSGVTDVFTALQKYSNKYIEEVEKEKNPQKEEIEDEMPLL